MLKFSYRQPGLRLAGLSFFILLAFLPFISYAQINFQLSGQPDKACLLCSKLPDSLVSSMQNGSMQAKNYVKVYTTPRQKNQPAILGRYFLENGKLSFCPYIGFQPGLTYEVFLNSSTEPEFTFQLPLDTSTALPRVVKVYPQNDSLPANQLKFYFFFSQPMSEGQAYRRIRVREKGRAKLLPNFFLELQPELWDKKHQRLTLWLEPGRIKRDLGPNNTLGPPLEIGKSYVLEIDSGWKDRRGRPLESNFKKEFFVREEDRQSPQTEQWTLKLPDPGSKVPLEIFFGESLDAVLSQSCFQIFTSEPNLVKGKFSLIAEEKGIHFTPQTAWSKGKYQILLEAKLEDLAGNNLNRLFDRDLKTEKKPLIARKTLQIDFVIE